MILWKVLYTASGGGGALQVTMRKIGNIHRAEARYQVELQLQMLSGQKNTFSRLAQRCVLLRVLVPKEELSNLKLRQTHWLANIIF